MSAAELTHRLEALAPLARAGAADADRNAELSDEVSRALQAAELFKLWVPQRFGGFELALPETLHIYETAGSIDGALGWAVMIGAGGGLFAAYLPAHVASKLFAAPGAVVAGSGAPSGRDFHSELRDHERR
jgi:alkylation response protein AidB-like acyl-CoA dehydrogenase